MGVPTVPGYSLRERIGAGSGGQVWRALRERDGAPVAVKVLVLPDAGLEECDRAAAEAGLMQAQVSDHIVRCHEAIALTAPAPAIALVMDFMDGGSLADVLRARGHLSLGETITVVSPTARALASLHAAGVVHGDVSPGNVLFDRSGRPSLSDLGVAQAVGYDAGGVFGTIGFTAPEVELGAHPTPPSDVYSLGALAWTCLTGTSPPVAALRPSLATEVPDLPQTARQMVMACLAGDPRARPSAGEAALALFDSAPATPIRLVTADDEVALLTRRIRAAAVEGDGHGHLGRQRRSTLWLRGAGRRPGRDDPGGQARGRCVGGRWRPGGSQLGRWAAIAVLLVALTSALGWHRLANAESARARVADGNPHASPQEVLADHARARGDPVAVVKALSELRARAWNAGDSRLLLACDAAGSAALAHDRELLRRASLSGATYEEVGFRVVWARLGDATQTAARIVARVDPTAYDVVVSGRVTHVAARPAPPMEFRLRWVAGRWLVDEVRAVSTPS